MPLPSIRVLLLIAMTLGPWAFNGTAQARELGDRIPLGKALTGEACHARFIRLIKKSGQQFWDIHCAGWETPSARLTTFKSSWDGLRIILHGGAYGRVKRRSQCQAPERTEILDGIGAQVQDCVLRSGGWRSFALVASVDRHAYLADGLPTTAPLAERLIGVLSGRLAEGAGDEGTMSVAIHRIEAFVEANGRLASSDEAMLYRQLFDLCVKQNNVNSYGASNKSCREALAVQEGVLGPGHPATADALSLIALNETRLGHLDDAAILFDKAQALFDRRGYQSDEYARHLTYRSTLALEREEPEKALDLAQQSVLHWRQSGRETGGLAHALSFKSDVLRSLKRYDEALRTAEDALRIHTQTLGSHSAWATFGQLRVARALIGLGRHDEAIKTLNDSLETTRILFGTGPRLGILYGVLGRAHLEKGDARAAFQAYSRAMAIAEENREYRAALDPARLDRPFEAGLRLAQQAPAEAQAVHDALFRFAQLPQGATVARTIRRMTARMASDTPAIGDLVRRLQDAERERLDRGARLGRALSQPEKDRDPAAEAALRADIDRADARYGALEQ
ncbi:MAG: tetratricopeptide repeat protein, partial [Rhodobacterales bacterium]|nr:tetratricopeptide repeat protein [Rhodobacterales bacterium]